MDFLARSFVFLWAFVLAPLIFAASDDRASPTVFLGEGSYGYVYSIEIKGESWAVKSQLLTDDNVDNARILTDVWLARKTGLCVGVYLRKEQSKICSVMTPYDYDLHKRIKEGPIPREAIPLLFGTLARRLAFLHEAGVIHGDLKPSNILLFREKWDSARLCDFGSATHTALAARAVIDGLPGCTRYYRAPEVLKYQFNPSTGSISWFVKGSSRPFGEASDNFALGCILAEIFLGEALFRPDSGEQENVLMYVVMEDLLSEKSSLSIRLSRISQADLRERVEACIERGERLLEIAKKEDVLDLLKGLLQINPIGRMLAKEAAAHRFVGKAADHIALEFGPCALGMEFLGYQMRLREEGVDWSVESLALECPFNQQRRTVLMSTK